MWRDREGSACGEENEVHAHISYLDSAQERQTHSCVYKCSYYTIQTDIVLFLQLAYT